MAGPEERREILRRLKARQAKLAAKAERFEARVGEQDYRPTLAGTYSKTTEPLRVTIRETEDGLGVHAPSARNMLGVAFVLVWLCGWAAGEWFALSEIARDGFNATAPFLIFWVTIWTIAGAGVVYALLWQLFGSERLFITGDAVVIDRGFGPFRRTKVWGPGEATGFRKAAAIRGKGKSVPAYGLAFDAGGTMRRFGANLTDREMLAVLAAIGRHLPDALQTSPVERGD